MAKSVLLQSYLSINSTDLSAYTSKIELKVDVEDKDVTTFGSSGWNEVLGGLKKAEVAATFKQDVAASALDSIMWPLLGTVVVFETRLSNAVVGVSNPKWTGSLLIKEWKPIGGSVGDVAEVEVSFPSSGVVTRGTS